MHDRSQRPLRIVLVSRYYPPDPGGGLALYHRQIAESFVKMGHTVTVIAAQSHNPKDASPLTVQRLNGVQLIRIQQHKAYRRSLTGLSCCWNSLTIAWVLERLHQKFPLDVVQCPATFFESLMFGLTGKREFNIPLVIKFHENAETYTTLNGRFQKLKQVRHQWFRQFLRRTSLAADCWMGVSQHALHSTLTYLDLAHLERLRSVSPSPIDTKLFSPEAPLLEVRPKALPTQPYLFFSGRLIREKGVLLLLKTFLEYLAPRYPDLLLVMAGEEDYRQREVTAQIHAQIQAHPLGERVKLPGRIAYEEMPLWYRGCTVFVAPSRCEPFGRIYIEAMACGTPVVGFDCCGAQEIMTHMSDGFLVEDQTPEALATGITMLLDTPTLREQLGREGRVTVMTAYGQDQVASQLIELYRSLKPSQHPPLDLEQRIERSETLPYVLRTPTVPPR
jgi:glycosyltransferase involved in cell wall biosynthesis